MKNLTCFLRDFAPAAIAVSRDASDELFVLLGRPKPPLHLLLVAARVVPHFNIELQVNKRIEN